MENSIISAAFPFAKQKLFRRGGWRACKMEEFRKLIGFRIELCCAGVERAACSLTELLIKLLLCRERALLLTPSKFSSPRINTIYVNRQQKGLIKAFATNLMDREHHVMLST